MSARSAMQRRARGFTLVELMIAMTLGLGTVAATGYIYLGTIKTYRAHDSMSRLQEGGRYAFELIGKDLRMAGTTGCPYATSANVVNTNTDWEKNLFGMPIVSVARDGVAGTETEFSDALRVLRADMTREYVVLVHDSIGGTFTLTGPHNITAGQYMIATDCNHAVVFQASVPAANQISHPVGGAPGNSTTLLGAGGVAYNFAPGSRLYRLDSTSYFVANNVAGQPSLFRSRPTGAAGVIAREELIEGVEDLRITYAVDTSIPADGQADFVDPDGDGNPYLTAAQVDSAAVPGANASQRWARVVSARISTLIRTNEDGIVPVAQGYTFNGVATVPADRRLRKVSTNVIRLRNR
jgi:type IV pilus assembly protein PilW